MSENKYMTNKLANTALTAAIILTAVIIGSASASALSYGTNKSTDVNVTITSEVALDVEPKTLQYSGVSIGSQVVETDRQFRGVTIENTGSEYIDKIWANTSTPDNRPFGSGLPSEYDAGNFLQIKPNLSQSSVSGAAVSDYFFVNRKEFKVPDSALPAYIVAPEDEITLAQTGTTVASENGEIHVGRFRRGAEELWFIIATDETNGGNDDCDGNSENAMMRVANVSATSSRLGTVDFTDDGPSDGIPQYDEYLIEENTGSSVYGQADSQVDLAFSTKTLTYDVLTTCSGASTMDALRTRFAVDPADTTDMVSEGYTTEFIVNAGNTASNMLLPGGTVPLETAIQVPTGVAEGEVSQGTLTLFATANTTAQR